MAGLTTYKPTSAGRRGMTKRDTSTLTTKTRVKSLVKGGFRNVGRSHGKISTRHRSTGGVKRAYRQIDWRRSTQTIAEVMAISYDPYRTAHIAHIKYEDGTDAYIIASTNMKVGTKIHQGETTPIVDGNALKLANVPSGLMVHNIELQPGRGAQIARSAGSYAIVQGIDKGYAQLKLSSGEIKTVSAECYATLGQVSNALQNRVTIGKAGRSRLMGKRPTVRGKAMHPAAHPHGGGEGNNPIGLRKGPKTPWGALALGVKTRNKRKKKLIKS